MSVRAVTNCELYALSREDFQEVIVQYPDFREALSTIAVARLYRLAKTDGTGLNNDSEVRDLFVREKESEEDANEKYEINASQASICEDIEEVDERSLEECDDSDAENSLQQKKLKEAANCFSSMRQSPVARTPSMITSPTPESASIDYVEKDTHSRLTSASVQRNRKPRSSVSSANSGENIISEDIQPIPRRGSVLPASFLRSTTSLQTNLMNKSGKQTRAKRKSLSMNQDDDCADTKDHTNRFYTQLNDKTMAKPLDSKQKFLMLEAGVEIDEAIEQSALKSQTDKFDEESGNFKQSHHGQMKTIFIQDSSQTNIQGMDENHLFNQSDSDDNSDKEPTETKALVNIPHSESAKKSAMLVNTRRHSVDSPSTIARKKSVLRVTFPQSDAGDENRKALMGKCGLVHRTSSVLNLASMGALEADIAPVIHELGIQDSELKPKDTHSIDYLERLSNLEHQVSKLSDMVNGVYIVLQKAPWMQEEDKKLQ